MCVSVRESREICLCLCVQMLWLCGERESIAGTVFVTLSLARSGPYIICTRLLWGEKEKARRVYIYNKGLTCVFGGRADETLLAGAAPILLFFCVPMLFRYTHYDALFLFIHSRNLGFLTGV